MSWMHRQYYSRHAVVGARATSIVLIQHVAALGNHAGGNEMPSPSERPALILQKAMVVILFIGFAAYIAMAVGFAAYFLLNAFLYQVGDFEKASIGAFIAVVGTGLTALGAVYAANRQALAAHQVEILRGETSEKLAELTANLTQNLEVIKTQSARSLERLKMHLDAEKNAYRELSGAAATYFYSLRSIAMNKWDEAALKAAEDGMIAATRHLIYVDQEMRDTWMAFWQEAQLIHRKGREETDNDKRPSIVEGQIMLKVSTADGKLDFRDQYLKVDDMARQAVARERSPETTPQIV
jgi:hypothetical protein